MWTKFLRLTGAAIGVVIAVRLLDLLLAPALPLLVMLLLLTVVFYVLLGRRGL